MKAVLARVLAAASIAVTLAGCAFAAFALLERPAGHGDVAGGLANLGVLLALVVCAVSALVGVALAWFARRRDPEDMLGAIAMGLSGGALLGGLALATVFFL